MATVSGNTVSVVLTMDSAQYSKGLDQAQRQLDRFKGKVRGVGHGTVSQMQAASGAIRLVEGGMNGSIRAAERFISTIPGVGAALQKAFPIIGGLAVGALFLRLGKEALDFKNKVDLIPDSLQRGFQALILAADTANDKLALTNDKLEGQIDKLEAKPNNNLHTALDAARVSADELAKSLGTDNDKINELLKKNQVGYLGSAVSYSNLAVTHGTAGSITYFSRQISDLAAAKQEALHNGDTAGAAAIDKQLSDKQNAAHAWSESTLARLNREQRLHKESLGFFADQSANIQLVSGFQSVIEGQTASAQQKARHNADEQQLEADRAKKAAEAKAAKDAQEKARRGAEAHRRMLEQQAKTHRRIVEGVAKYRTYQNDTYTHQQGAADIGQRLVRSNAQSWATKNAKALETSNRLVAAQEKYQHALNQSNRAQERAAINIALSAGAISDEAAAKQRAAIDTAEYANESKRLADQLVYLRSLTPKDTAAKWDIARQVQDVQTSQLQLNSQYGIAHAQSISDIQSNTTLGGATNVLIQFAQSVSNAGQAIGNFAVGSIQTFNQALLAPPRSGYSHWGAAGRSIVMGGANTLLNYGEGKLLGMLGMHHGKPGTKGNPMWVRLAEHMGGAAKSGLASILGIFKRNGPHAVGASTSTAGSTVAGLSGAASSILGAALTGGSSGATGSSGSTMSAIGSAAVHLLPLIPGFAGGGSVPSGTLAMVGEQGPELAYFGGGGHVTPNHALSSVGSTHFHFGSIHVNGSTDPAATRMAVQQGIRKAVATSVAVHHQQAIRKPHK